MLSPGAPVEEVALGKGRGPSDPEEEPGNGELDVATLWASCLIQSLFLLLPSSELAL